MKILPDATRTPDDWTTESESDDYGAYDTLCEENNDSDSDSIPCPKRAPPAVRIVRMQLMHVWPPPPLKNAHKKKRRNHSSTK